MLSKARGIVGQTQKIVNGYGIELGQLDQHLRGDIALAEFIVAVNLLGTV